MDEKPYEEEITIDYRCSQCGKTEVKLWRQYNTMACYIELMCCDCAAKDQNEDISKMNEDGTYPNEYEMLHDQIGFMVPAVPVRNEDTYWGYTSVPDDGVNWWKQLPLK